MLLFHAVMAQPSSAAAMRAAGRRGACHTWAATLSWHAPVTEALAPSTAAPLSQPVSPTAAALSSAVIQPCGCWQALGSAPLSPSRRELPDNPLHSTYITDHAAPCSFREAGPSCPRLLPQRGGQWPTPTGTQVRESVGSRKSRLTNWSLHPLLERACAVCVARFPFHGRSRPASSITSAKISPLKTFLVTRTSPACDGKWGRESPTLSTEQLAACKTPTQLNSPVSASWPHI